MKGRLGDCNIIIAQKRQRRVETVSTMKYSWNVMPFRQKPAEDMALQTVHNAVLSRVDSGRIYWEGRSPSGFIRGAVYDHRGFLVPESQRKGGVNADIIVSSNPLELASREKAEANENFLEGRWLYAGNWMHPFGHFLVETLPNLWPLLDDPSGFAGIVAHRFNSPQTPDWQFEIVKLLTGVEVRVIDDEPATVEELVVAPRPYDYQQAISPLADRVWNLISERAGEDTQDEMGVPVYLSRTEFERGRLGRRSTTGREFINGDEVDAVFAEHGFRVVQSETMTVTEQIRLARSAPILAGPSGSALHLSVFCRPGARVIEVGDARTRNSMVSTQQAISAAKQQEAAHIPYQADDEGRIDLHHLRSRLMELMGASVSESTPPKPVEHPATLLPTEAPAEQPTAPAASVPMGKKAIKPDEYDLLEEAGWYAVQFEHFELNFYFRPSEVKRAFVISPGFVTRAENPHPYFQRIKMFNDLDGTCISLADPSLDLAEDVQLGWFLGSRWVDYTTTIARFLEGLFAHFGIPNENALFFGSSAGGFVSLVLGTYVRGSKVLAMNPQTELLRFHDVRELSRVLEAGWPGVSNMTIYQDYAHRFSIAKLWEREQHIPNATVMINTYDGWHIEHHLAPMLKGMANKDIERKSFQVRFFSSEASGHNPLPASRIIPVLKELNGI